MRRLIRGTADARIDYVALVDAATLEPQERLHGRVAILVAVWVGRTRLIDNLLVDVS
jgi:pantoate--beta-alanine ligase